MNRSLELVKTIYEIKQLEPFAEPQIAIAGRSNVGKSSLINRLAGRTRLAKTSSKPGKTRSLNCYRVAPDGFMLVDLPGYGYARCSKAERSKWSRLIEAFIRDNQGLKAVVVLLDSRLPPQQLDLDLTGYLSGLGLPIIPVLTKADKSKQQDRARVQRQWQAILGQERPPLLFSSTTGLGEEKLWAMLAACAA